MRGAGLSLHYLGLRLRMDPKLNWLQVVARDKPLLQCGIPGHRKENKDSLVPKTQNSLQPCVGTALRRWPRSANNAADTTVPWKSSALCCWDPMPLAPPHDLPNTCPLNMTVAQLSLPFFKTKTMFPGMTCSSSGVSGTKPNSTRCASPSKALKGTQKTQPIIQLGPHTSPYCRRSNGGQRLSLALTLTPHLTVYETRAGC